jgi:hypothetical protein
MAMDVEKKHTKLRYVCVSVERNNKMAAMRFLGAFAKLQRATIRFVMSIRMEHLGSQWTDFHEI